MFRQPPKSPQAELWARLDRPIRYVEKKTCEFVCTGCTNCRVSGAIRVGLAEIGPLPLLGVHFFLPSFVLPPQALKGSSANFSAHAALGRLRSVSEIQQLSDDAPSSVILVLI